MDYYQQRNDDIHRKSVLHVKHEKVKIVAHTHTAKDTAKRAKKRKKQRMITIKIIVFRFICVIDCHLPVFKYQIAIKKKNKNTTVLLNMKFY